MAQYRIYFFGLILHVNVNGKGHSAVVWDNDHDARLLFGPGDEVNLLKIPSIDILADDLTAMPADLQPTFKDYVPSAQKILGGDLESDVRGGTGDDATYLHHVGGKLYAARLYPSKAQHFRGGTEVRPKSCVASMTLMLLESAKPVAIKAGPVTRPFPSDRCILVANFDREDSRHDPNNKPHIRKYSQLTDGSDTAITIKEHESERCPELEVPIEPCDWVLDVISKEKRGLVTSAHSECGNNQWP